MSFSLHLLGFFTLEAGGGRRPRVAIISATIAYQVPPRIKAAGPLLIKSFKK